MKAPAAIALRYDGRTAPRVTAKGDAEVAAHILALARHHDIPIYQDERLTRLLSQVDLDMEIPMALYVAVAEVIAFAYQLKGTLPPAPPVRGPGQTYDHE